MKKIDYLCSAIVIMLLMVSQISHAQSSNPNYITTETFLDSLGTKKVTSVQYYDGLGRPNVLAANGLGPAGKYVYTMTEYDNMGREAKTWLPAVGTTSPVFISTSTMSTQSQNTYEGDAYAYSEVTYDTLGRPVFVSTPGDAWYQAGKGVRTEYKTNTANSVKRYVISPTTYTISQDGYYASGMLTCVKTTDEDGKKIEVYKDFMDKVILERRGNNNDTYYVYNNQGLLCGVLPPLYQTQGNDDLIYQYKYDGYGRCIEKTLPGCSPISYEYDKCGRLAFMKDGMMSGNSCRFYLYDQLNRLVIQGFCSGKNINPTTSLPATAVYGTGDTEITGTGYYISSAYALVNPTIEIVNYYDNYQFLSHPALLDSIGNVSLNRTGHANATSFQTGQLVKTSNGRYLCAALYYNQKGQVVETCENTLNGVILNTTTTYTFTGKPITINESVTKNNTTRTAIQQNTYNANTDHLLTRTHQYGSTSITTGAYAYDDLGRLDSVSRYLDRTSVRYTYDLHGWLTNIQGYDHYHNQLLFNEKLHYADGSRTPYYNGNISCAKYITPDYPMGQGNQCVYEYTYDGLNRLTNALFGYGAVNSNNVTFSSHFSESMTYDANSNIKLLTRYGKMNNGNYNAIDILDFTYDGGNRLYSIIDHGQNLVTEGAFDFKDDLIDSFYAPEYGYNYNGSLTYDANKGVSWIDYDQLGNPVRVQFTDHSITEHVYAADGRRLKTIHRTSVPQSPSLGIGVTASLPSSLTQSIDSVDYVGNFIYEKGQLKRYMFDDGYLRLNTNNTCVPRFFIKDHLGNNRILTDGSGNIKQNTNYYPYGGMTSISTGQGEQQFKYNGKEYDPMHGLNEYDYGARQYDPARCQFTTMDPLCEKYYHISPYAYCGGNPVNAVDPDGRSPIYDTEGNFLGTDDEGIRGHYYMMNSEDFKQGMSHKDVFCKYSIKKIPSDIEAKIRKHYKGLAKRPDYDGFVTIEEGIAWAQSHPNALKNPTPENTLYIDASKLDFGSLSASDFSKENIIKKVNLFNNLNTIESLYNSTLRSTVYALGYVQIILKDSTNGIVEIVNNSATDYDWNVGGGIKRNTAIHLNNCIFNIDPQKHGFKTYYYGKGKLRK